MRAKRRRGTARCSRSRRSPPRRPRHGLGRPRTTWHVRRHAVERVLLEVRGAAGHEDTRAPRGPRGAPPCATWPPPRASRSRWSPPAPPASPPTRDVRRRAAARASAGRRSAPPCSPGTRSWKLVALIPGSPSRAAPAPPPRSPPSRCAARPGRTWPPRRRASAPAPARHPRSPAPARSAAWPSGGRRSGRRARRRRPSWLSTTASGESTSANDAIPRISGTAACLDCLAAASATRFQRSIRFAVKPVFSSSLRSAPIRATPSSVSFSTASSERAPGWAIQTVTEGALATASTSSTSSTPAAATRALNTPPVHHHLASIADRRGGAPAAGGGRRRGLSCARSPSRGRRRRSGTMWPASGAQHLRRPAVDHRAGGEPPSVCDSSRPETSSSGGRSVRTSRRSSRSSCRFAIQSGASGSGSDSTSRRSTSNQTPFRAAFSALARDRERVDVEGPQRAEPEPHGGDREHAGTAAEIQRWACGGNVCSSSSAARVEP